MPRVNEVEGERLMELRDQLSSKVGGEQLSYTPVATLLVWYGIALVGMKCYRIVMYGFACNCIKYNDMNRYGTKIGWNSIACYESIVQPCVVASDENHFERITWIFQD